MDGCWMVGESGIKANSAQFSWSLAELGNRVKIVFDCCQFCLVRSPTTFKTPTIIISGRSRIPGWGWVVGPSLAGANSAKLGANSAQRWSLATAIRHKCKATHYQDTYWLKNKLYWVDVGWLDVGCWLYVGWMLDGCRKRN